MLISAIKILIALAFAYGMVAIYLILPSQRTKNASGKSRKDKPDGTRGKGFRFYAFLLRENR